MGARARGTSALLPSSGLAKVLVHATKCAKAVLDQPGLELASQPNTKIKPKSAPLFKRVAPKSLDGRQG